VPPSLSMKSVDSYGSRNGLPVSPSRSGSGATDSKLGVCRRGLLIGVHPIVHITLAIQHGACRRFQEFRACARACLLILQYAEVSSIDMCIWLGSGEAMTLRMRFSYSAVGSPNCFILSNRNCMF